MTFLWGGQGNLPERPRGDRLFLAACASTLVRVFLEASNADVAWHIASRFVSQMPGKDCPDSLRTIAGFEREKFERNLETGGFHKLLIDDLARCVGESPATTSSPAVGWIQFMFSLAEAEAKVLHLICQYANDSGFRDLIGGSAIALGRPVPPGALDMATSLISVLCELPPNHVEEILDKESRLCSSGLIHREMGKETWVSPTALVTQLVEAEEADFETILLGSVNTETLPVAAFANATVRGPDPKDLLVQALHKQVAGVNLLVYGPEGTGKSSYVESLVAEAGLRAIHLSGNSSNTPARERIARLKSAQAMAVKLTQSVLVVDDGELTLEAAESRQEEEGILSGNAVPVIWVSRQARGFSAEALRRMMGFVEFGRFTSGMRTAVVEKILSLNSAAWGNKAAEKLATIDADPGMFEVAIRSALVTGGRVETALEVLAGTRRARGFAEAPVAPASPLAYDMSLVNADMDMSDVLDRCAASDDRALSFLLHGAPGSGKTEFVRALSERLEMPVLKRRASDLLGRYVGDSEKAIADAFREAREREAILQIDEGDSLLADRRMARHNWEISQVNEILSWMESHPLPYVVTTNLMTRIDYATYRRFLFIIRFDAMRPEQVERAYRSAFRRKPPARMAKIEGLTPGDFAVIARRTRVLGVTSGAEIADMFERHAALKAGQALGCPSPS